MELNAIINILLTLTEAVQHLHELPALEDRNNVLAEKIINNQNTK